VAYDYFGTATAAAPPVSGPPTPPTRSAARHVRRAALLLLAIATIGGTGFALTRPETPKPTGPPVAIPETIAGYRLTGPVYDMMTHPQQGPYNKKHGVIQELTAQFEAADADPAKFTVRLYRKPAYSRHDPAKALAEAFKGDDEHPEWMSPAHPFPAGPLGGALICRTLREATSFCNWVDGEVVGSVMFYMNRDLDAMAALTLKIRAAVQA